jgi:Uma2 family endonuclease
MSTAQRSQAQVPIEYPTSDGKPMAETDIHRDDMIDLIATLRDRFAADPLVYVSGNILLFYEEGNKHKHVSPDVLVVRGIPKLPLRDHYLRWKEGRSPDVVIELTSKSTRREDQEEKMALYRDVLGVTEYFLFDPKEEYLKPSMQGYRLTQPGRYEAIAWEAGRLPSVVLGLHLERRGPELRLYDPATGRILPTPQEGRQQEAEARQRAEEARQRAEEARQRAEEASRRDAEARQRAEEVSRREAEARQRAEEASQRDAESRQQAEQARQQAEEARERSEAEIERLRRELEAWKRSASGGA